MNCKIKRVFLNSRVSNLAGHHHQPVRRRLIRRRIWAHHLAPRGPPPGPPPDKGGKGRGKGAIDRTASGADRRPLVLDAFNDVHDDYMIDYSVKPLGTGHYGKVWAAVRRADGEKVAVKTIIKRKLRRPAVLLREIHELGHVPRKSLPARPATGRGWPRPRLGEQARRTAEGQPRSRA